MTNPITKTELDRAFRRYVDACQTLGLIPDGFHVVMSTGSKLYGNAYRVALTGDRINDPTDGNHYPNGSGHNRPPAGPDYLGMTKRDAYDALHGRAATLEDVARAYRFHDIVEISTGDHALVISYDRPTSRDDAARTARRILS